MHLRWRGQHFGRHKFLAGGLPSRSLKLLPMLGVPSLPSLEYPFRFNSAVLRGDSGPEGCLRPLDDGLDMKAAEFSDESELDDF